jgi:hypothetical protein
LTTKGENSIPLTGIGRRLLETLAILREVEWIGGSNIDLCLFSGPFIQKDGDIVRCPNAPVVAAARTDVKIPDELLGNVGITALFTFLPGVRRDLQTLPLRGTRFLFLTEPSH